MNYSFQLKCCGVDNARDWFDCGGECGLGGTYKVTFKSTLALCSRGTLLPESFPRFQRDVASGRRRLLVAPGRQQIPPARRWAYVPASNAWEHLLRENYHFESKYLSGLPKDHSNRTNLGWYVRQLLYIINKVLKRTFKQIITLFRYAFEGCFTKIVDTIEENQGIVSGVAIGVVAVMVRISLSSELTINKILY